MYILLIQLIIFAGCFAFLMNAGMWSNTLTLVNAIFAGLIAMNYFEPLADFLDKQVPSATYLWDFISLWLIFAIAFTVLRTASDQLSKVRVRFFLPLEKVGGIVMCLWSCWIIVCFATMTLHTAPLSRNFLGFQEEPESKSLFGLGPDRLWLAWVQRESLGPYVSLAKRDPFDKNGDFVIRYASRRADFEKQLSTLKD